jgi:hypothetical protein
MPLKVVIDDTWLPVMSRTSDHTGTWLNRCLNTSGISEA